MILDNIVSLHASLGFAEIKEFFSIRSLAFLTFRKVYLELSSAILRNHY
jgi:hypothetical protein